MRESASCLSASFWRVLAILQCACRHIFLPSASITMSFSPLFFSCVCLPLASLCLCLIRIHMIGFRAHPNSSNYLILRSLVISPTKNLFSIKLHAQFARLLYEYLGRKTIFKSNARSKTIH